MEDSGIIEPLHSEWASPIVVVKKNDRSLRLCVDFECEYSYGCLPDAQD